MKEKKFHGDYYRPPESKRAAKFAAIIISAVITIFIMMILILILSSCTGPGTMVREGYLVSISDKKTEVKKFESIAQVDSFIFARTGIPVESEKMLGGILFFYELRNEDFSIYVEKKGIYQKKARGKERWRMFDEKLAKNDRK